MGDDNGDSKEKKSSSSIIPFLLKIFGYIVILFIIFGLFSSLYATGTNSGALNVIGVKLKPVFSPIIDVVSSIGKLFKNNVLDWFTGEQTFSLEEQTIETKKTGFELDDLVVTRGITYNDIYTGEDIKARTVLKVNELPSEIEKITVGFECYLDDIKGQIFVNGKPIFNLEGGKDFTDIYNPKKGGSDQYNIDCLISKDKIIPNSFLPQIRNIKTIKFNLNYLRENKNAERVFLTVFIIPNEKLYNEYQGKSNDAFKDLMFGIYNNYKSTIPSNMRYKSDISAIMNFDEQPLGVNNKYKLSFQFKNNIFGKGNVSVRGFKINLPDGFRFDNCEFLNGNELKKEYFNPINDELNNGRGQSAIYDCDVFVELRDYGGGEDLIMLEKEDGITADFGFEERMSKEKDIIIAQDKRV